MNEDLRAQILAEIDELAGVPELRPTDITIADLKELWNVTDAAAVSRMKKLVEEGRYETFMAYDRGRRRVCRGYRRVGTGAEGDGTEAGRS